MPKDRLGQMPGTAAAVDTRAPSDKDNSGGVPSAIGTLQPWTSSSLSLLQVFRFYGLLVCNIFSGLPVTGSSSDITIRPLPKPPESQPPSVLAVASDVCIQMLTTAFARQLSNTISWCRLVHRLATFNCWPRDFAWPSPLDLAVAGFCYAGHGTDATCFSCGLTLQHFAVYPLTAHLENSSGKCKLLEDILAGVVGQPSNAWQQQPQWQWQLCLTPASDMRLVQLSSLLALPNCRDEQILPQSHVQSWMQQTRQQGQRRQSRTEATDFKREVLRLDSFRNRWNYRHIVKPEDLARNGFFYTGVDDRVECAFCHGTCSDWKTGDIIDSRHARLVPKCTFVNGRDDVGNVPSPFSPLQSSSSDFSCSPGFVTPSDSAATSTFPARPYYANESNRKASFTKWPKQDHCSSDVLMKTGFFFTGISDVIACFHCGLQLSAKDLQPLSDGSDKHVPSCRFANRSSTILRP